MLDTLRTLNLLCLPLPAHRGTIYKSNFPAGSWLEVKGLALPEFVIEIELEAHARRSRRGR